MLNINDFLTNEECTMIEAMKQLDLVAKKVLFVTKNNQLVAALTDGDIRRWILKKGNLDAKVRDIANYNPKFLYESEKSKAKQLMKQYIIESVPIVNSDMEIVTIVFWNDFSVGKVNTLDVPVVMMAGGLGARLYPYTKILPKPLIPIGEIPIAEHIINRFFEYGIKDFYMVVNHKKNMIKAYFNEIEREYLITYIDELQPLGTGGGLSLLKGIINNTFILSNCDILITEDYSKIYNFHKENGNKITIICSLKKVKIPYGVVEIGENGDMDSMKEKPEISFFTNTGVYIVEPDVIQDLENNKSIDFPDIIQKHKNRGEKIGVYPISENAWLDMGQFSDMEEMKKRLGYNE